MGFVANRFNRRYYVQSALNVDTNEKLQQKQRSLINIPDGFKRVIVVEDITVLVGLNIVYDQRFATRKIIEIRKLFE